MSREFCPTCTRAKWLGTNGPITERECPSQNSPSCKLATQRNSLAAALRKLIASACDAPTRRACLVVLESVFPSSHVCPMCGQSGVVVKSEVRIHFPSNKDTVPCKASFGTVLGGILLTRSS